MGAPAAFVPCDLEREVRGVSLWQERCYTPPRSLPWRPGRPMLPPAQAPSWCESDDARVPALEANGVMD